MWKIAWWNLCRDKARFGTAVVGLVFSVVLMAVQSSIFLGAVHSSSLLVEQADADLWLVPPHASNADSSGPMPGDRRYHVLGVPGVACAGRMIVGFGISLGKLDEVRLRAEVDEADISGVHLGQSVIATADALGDRVLRGHVVHMEPIMGRKTIRTQRATERKDTKVREVLIELQPGHPSLPIDLQMTVRFVDSPPPAMLSETRP